MNRKDFINWSHAAQNSNVSGQDYHNSLRTQLMNQKQDRTRQIVEEKMYGKLNAPRRKSSRNRTIRNQITESLLKKGKEVASNFKSSPVVRSVGTGLVAYTGAKVVGQVGKLVKPGHTRQSQKQYGGEEPESFGKSARQIIPTDSITASTVGLAGAGLSAIKSAKKERDHDHHPENVANHPHRAVHNTPAASSNTARRVRTLRRNVAIRST